MDFESLFSKDFMPHGHCYLWKPEIVWLHTISDTIIFLAYVSIPIVLAYIVYKSKKIIPYNYIIILFSLFILSCGTTHLMEIVNIWKSEYFVSGIIKAITAIASLLTAIALFPFIPKILKLIDESDLDEK